MPKTVTHQQMKFLLSKGTPLSKEQLGRFKRELEKGEVKVIKKRLKK